MANFGDGESVVLSIGLERKKALVGRNLVFLNIGVGESSILFRKRDKVEVIYVVVKVVCVSRVYQRVHKS